MTCCLPWCPQCDDLLATEDDLCELCGLGWGYGDDRRSAEQRATARATCGPVNVDADGREVPP